MNGQRWSLRVLGLVLVAAAVGLFIWLEGTAAAGRAIELLAFAGLYLVPAGLGFWLLLRGLPRWGGPLPAIVLAFFLLAIAGLLGGGERRPGGGRDERPPQPESAAPYLPEPLLSLVERVQAVERAGRTMLDSTTCEVLYEPGAAVASAPWPRAARDWLVVRYGLDPLLGRLYQGDIELSLVAAPATGEPIELFSTSLTFPPQSAAPRPGWHEVVIDLRGRKLAAGELRLIKRARPQRPFVGRRLELAPTDLVYWSRPVFVAGHRPDRPNLLLISLDTLRADHVGTYGYHRPTTPNIDAFAEQAVVFEQAIAQSPWTTPSHFSILTGTYPHQNGSDDPVDAVPRRFPTTPMLSHLLRERGFFPVAFTGQGSISASFGFYQGFAFYREHRFRLEPNDIDRVYASAAAWLDAHADKRFFMFFHTYEPHQPFQDRTFIEREGLEAADERIARIARYDGDIRRTDAYVGKLLAKLEALGLADETLVVILSDHGEELADRAEQFGGEVWGHGHSLFDELLWVPLLIRLPAEQRVVRRIGWQVRTVDIAPTLLELLGVAVPTHVSGISLAGAIHGDEQHQLPALSEATTYGPAMRSLRWRGIKYMRRVGLGQVIQSRHPQLPFWPAEQLFDLRADPAERRDLIGQRRALADRYRRELARYRADAEAAAAPTGGALDPEVVESLRSLGYVQ